jgi:hypothetical protein
MKDKEGTRIILLGTLFGAVLGAVSAWRYVRDRKRHPFRQRTPITATRFVRLGSTAAELIRLLADLV